MPNTKEFYLSVRSIAPAGLPMAERAAHLLYLNKTCFRGLFRVNRRGEFNVPYGAYDRRYYDEKNLASFAQALQRVEIRTGDFELAVHDSSRGDFIYFAPPYYKLGGYSDFNRYTAAKFHESDHIRLGAVCRELDARGVHWAISNSDTPLVRSLFGDFQVRRVKARREINLRASNRSISELLITNYQNDRRP